MGIRNPGGGGAPAGAIGTGKTAYVSPAFIQNANGFFDNFANAITYLNMQVGETGELVVYPGTYAGKLNFPAVNTITLLIRGFVGYRDQTILAGGMGGNFTAGGNNATFKVFNLSAVNAGNHGADFYLDNSGNIVNYTFDNCNFETGAAGSAGLYFQSWNGAAANHRGTFINCRFHNSAGGNSFNDDGRHVSETTWKGCTFGSRVNTGSQQNGRTWYYEDCTFLDFVGITQALGTTIGRLEFDNCRFTTYVSVDNDTNKPEAIFRHCRFYSRACSSAQADAIWYFDSCVFRGYGAEFTVFNTLGVAGASWHLYNCVIENGKIMLTNGDAATIVNLANCTIRNDQYGAVFADLAAGAAGITSYNLVSDVTTAAGIVVTGAGNQYPVAI